MPGSAIGQNTFLVSVFIEIYFWLATVFITVVFSVSCFAPVTTWGTSSDQIDSRDGWWCLFKWCLVIFCLWLVYICHKNKSVWQFLCRITALACTAKWSQLVINLSEWGFQRLVTMAPAASNHDDKFIRHHETVREIWENVVSVWDTLRWECSESSIEILLSSTSVYISAIPLYFVCYGLYI